MTELQVDSDVRQIRMKITEGAWLWLAREKKLSEEDIGRLLETYVESYLRDRWVPENAEDPIPVSDYEIEQLVEHVSEAR